MADKPEKVDVDMVEVADTQAPEGGDNESNAVETAAAAGKEQSPTSKSPATEDKDSTNSVKDDQEPAETSAPKATAEIEQTETQVAVVAERTVLLTVSSC